jgi:ceramide glucosyltransferase
LRAVIAGALLVASAAGLAYLALALQRTLAFGRRRRRTVASPEFTPPVTILKPLCGREPNLLENLSSFCDQDYPEFQVIFGVRDADDEAVAVAREVATRFPACDVSLVIDDRVSGANRKIANVLNMMPNAKHDILIVADSDVCVGRTYLRSVVAQFADEHVGAVTCLYRGTPVQPGTTAELGALFVNDQFAPSVLVAVTLSPMNFCLGATMAVTRKILGSIGGFEVLSAYLADDQMLGKLVRDQGFDVALSSEVVATDVGDLDVKSLWQHEVRWARTMRAAQPWGFSFSFITYALPLALAYAAVSGNAAISLALVSLAAVLRVSVHYAVRSALDIRSRDVPWLIPVRDVLGLGVWAAHFFGKSVRWRDTGYTVDSAGRLHPLDRG